MEEIKLKNFCEKFTGGQKVGIGACLFLISLCIFGVSKADGNQGYAGYLILVAGITCMWSVLLSKINHCNVNFILYILFAVIPTCIIVSCSLAVDMSSSIYIGIIAIAAILNWIGNVVLISIDNIFKRIVMGFFGLLLNVLVIVGGIVAIAIATMPE